MSEARLVAGLPEIPAEMSPVSFRWRTALDNYEPMPRREAVGTLTRYIHRHADGSPSEIRARLESGITELKDAERSLFIIDDGVTVTPMYVIGYHHGGPSPLFPDGHDPFVMIGQFPVNIYNGQPVRRANDGRPVDYSTWMLGPRRTYHLKLD